MIGRSSVLGLAALAGLVLLLMAPTAPLASHATAVLPGSASAAGIPAPAKSVGSTHSPATTVPSAARPADQTCPTPQTAPRWNSLNFFNDVEVSFSVPGSPSLDGGGFNVAPCGNTLPTYLNGFTMTVTTNVAMVNAVVTIWGTGWPNASNPAPIIKGFDPATPTNISMNLPTTARTTAVYYFDLYRYFWPGSHVYFNLTVESASATPSTIYSANPRGGISSQYNDSGLVDNFTWQFYVQSVWSSPDFATDIAIHTTPSVLSNPAYEPNRLQNLTVNLTSLTKYNGTLQAIPHAVLYIYEYGKGSSGNNYSLIFGPPNGTTVSASIPPNPGLNATFNVTAYLPWRGGAIDVIHSLTYRFNWTNKGGWWYPTLGLLNNVNVTTSPALTLGSTKNTLGTATEVNVTIRSPIENVTLGKAEIHVHYSDAVGSVNSVVYMTAIDQNISYGLIPGVPSGGSVTFYITAKDLFGTPISSGNTTYTESGPLSSGPGGLSLAPGYGFFFFEAVDLSTGNLVSHLNYTITNATWSETKQGTPLGVAAPTPLAGAGYLGVTFGTYVVTIHAYGQTQTATISVSDQTPFVVVFYVASGAVAQNTWVQQTTFTIPAFLGLVGAALAVVPVSNWFRERRRKIEQEQKRITL